MPVVRPGRPRRRHALATAVASAALASGCVTEGGGFSAGGLFACVPAVSVGEPGALVTPEQLPPDQPVSAMLVWEKSVPSKAGASATGAGATVVGTFPAHRALAVRATGAQLLRLRGELTGAQVYLASTGTTELCVQRRR